jgi:hypothetical protein
VLTLMLACAVLIGLAYTYKKTLGKLLSELVSLGSVSVSIAGIYSFHPFGFLGRFAASVDHAIQSAIGKAITHTKAALNRALLWVAYSIQWIGQAIEGLALDQLKAVQWLVAHTIPAISKVVTNTFVKPVEHTITRVEHVTHTVTRVIEHTVTHTRVVVQRAAGTAAVAVAHTIAIDLPRIKTLESDWKAIRARFHALRWLAAFTGLAALTTAIVSRLGIGWIRCDKWRKFGPGVCRTPLQSLEQWLLGLTAIFGTLDLLTFAREMQSLVSATESEVRHFWRADVSKLGAPRQLGSSGL